MSPYPVRSRIQEPETPSPVAGQVACLHWRDGVAKPPQEMRGPKLEVIIVGAKVLAEVNIQCQRSGVD